MGAAPVVAKKLTRADSPGALEAEMMRKCKTYRNNVDPERSEMNITWQRNGLDFETAMNQRIAELNLKRALRSDAIKAEGFVVSAGSFTMDNNTALLFLLAANAWFDERYGEENTISWAIHFDEGVPHLHRWQVPVITGKEEGEYDRVSAKELFSPEKLKELQRDFYNDVASRFGYDKPLTKEEREEAGIGYAGYEAWKAKMESKEAHAELEQTQEKLNSKKKTLDNAEKVYERLNQGLLEKSAQVVELRQEIKALEIEKKELTSEVSELRKEKSVLQEAIEKFEKKIEEVIERFRPYMPEPLVQLARYFRDRDFFKIETWHEDMNYAAEMMSVDLPSKYDEQWEFLIRCAKDRAAEYESPGRGIDDPCL